MREKNSTRRKETGEGQNEHHSEGTGNKSPRRRAGSRHRRLEDVVRSAGGPGADRGGARQRRRAGESRRRPVHGPARSERGPSVSGSEAGGPRPGRRFSPAAGKIFARESGPG